MVASYFRRFPFLLLRQINEEEHVYNHKIFKFHNNESFSQETYNYSEVLDYDPNKLTEFQYVNLLKS